MAKIRWTIQALEDLENIYTYIARDSEIYASILSQKIITMIEKLDAFPKMGRIVPEKNDEMIRELILPPYRILYRIEDHAILIISIIHSSQQLNI